MLSSVVLCLLTGGADYGKHYKRVVARQHRTARGQLDELQGDERAPWVHVKASREFGKERPREAERDTRGHFQRKKDK